VRIRSKIKIKIKKENQKKWNAPRRTAGCLMKGKLRRVLPLLHKLVEERAGERRFPHSHPALH
jgi:hypothetical protein